MRLHVAPFLLTLVTALLASSAHAIVSVNTDPTKLIASAGASSRRAPGCSIGDCKSAERFGLGVFQADLAASFIGGMASVVVDATFSHEGFDAVFSGGLFHPGNPDGNPTVTSIFTINDFRFTVLNEATEIRIQCSLMSEKVLNLATFDLFVLKRFPNAEVGGTRCASTLPLDTTISLEPGEYLFVGDLGGRAFTSSEITATFSGQITVTFSSFVPPPPGVPSMSTWGILVLTSWLGVVGLRRARRT